MLRRGGFALPDAGRDRFQDLSMMRSKLVQRLNAEVGAMVIADVRIY